MTLKTNGEGERQSLQNNLHRFKPPLTLASTSENSDLFATTQEETESDISSNNSQEETISDSSSDKLQFNSVEELESSHRPLPEFLFFGQLYARLP